MKIHYVLNHVFGGGGTISTTIGNANRLAARGHDVTIASVTRRQDEGRFPVSDDVAVVFLTDARQGSEDRKRPEWKEPSRIAPVDERRARVYSKLTDIRIRQYVSAAKGVVVGTRPALNVMVARWARRAARVGQEHTYLARREESDRPQTLDAIRDWYPRLDALVTLTTQDAEDYRAFLPRTRIETIPNPATTLDLGLVSTTEEHRVVTAGRLTAPKGFDRLIRGYAPLVSQFPDWRLDIFGAGPEEEALAAMIADEGAIQLRGFTEDLPGEMSRAGLLAMTSRFEGMPMVMLEAMGVGLPVVSYDFRSGPRDLVEDGVNGCLVPDGDTPGLTRALAAVMSDPELRARMGAESRRKAATFAPDVVAARWEGLFSDLVSAPTLWRRLRRR